MKILMTTVAVAAMAFAPQEAQAQLFGGLDNGTLLGGTIGAGLGGAIGSNLAGSGQRDEGTAIGAALGGLAGAAYANRQSNFYGNPFAGQFNPGFNGRNLAGAGIGAGLGGIIGSNLAGSGVRQEGTALGAVLGGAAGFALANRGSSRYGGLQDGGFSGGFNGGGFGPAGPGFASGPAFGAPGFGAPTFGAPGFGPTGPGFVGGPAFGGAPGFGGPGLPLAPVLSGPQFVPSGQFITGPIMPVTRFVQPAPRPVILSQPRTVFTAPVSQGITYAASNVRLAGPEIRPTVVRRTVTVQPAPIIRAERVMAPPADCPAGTTPQSDGSCMERTVSYTAPSTSYSTPSYSAPSYSAPAPVISQPYVAPQMADCPAGTTAQSDGTCMEHSVSYSAPSYSTFSSTSSYSAPSYSSSSVTSSYSSSVAPASCPAGTTAQSDGTCLSSSVTSYTPSYNAPSYSMSSSSTTSYRAPKMYKSQKQMHHLPETVVRGQQEYCYSGSDKRYDSLGNQIKVNKHDHCKQH